jgi:hypothetical protein
MNPDANAVVPFASKNLGDLSKNNAEVNEVLFTILRAVEVVEAHKATGRKPSVSHFIFLSCINTSSIALKLFYFYFY